MLRRLFYFFTAILLFSISCSFVKFGESTFPIRIYKSTTQGLYVDYINLKGRDSTFECYYPAIGETIVGSYCVKYDTLILTPRISYTFNVDASYEIKSFKDMSFYCIPFDSVASPTSIKRKFLIKNKWKKLIEITDYSQLWQNRTIILDSPTSPIVRSEYKLVNKQSKRK